MAGKLVLPTSWVLSWGYQAGTSVLFHVKGLLGFPHSMVAESQEVVSRCCSCLKTWSSKLAHHYFCHILLVKAVTGLAQVQRNKKNVKEVVAIFNL